jgi:hypothetical protein
LPTSQDVEVLHVTRPDLHGIGVFVHEPVCWIFISSVTTDPVLVRRGKALSPFSEPRNE